jgi:hypothetical protein
MAASLREAHEKELDRLNSIIIQSDQSIRDRDQHIAALQAELHNIKSEIQLLSNKDNVMQHEMENLHAHHHHQVRTFAPRAHSSRVQMDEARKDQEALHRHIKVSCPQN